MHLSITCCIISIPSDFKTEKMCIKAAEDYPGTLEVLPDHVKTQEIRYKVVKGDSSSLQVVPDWFITKDWIDMWNDDDKDKPFEWYDDDKAKFFELYNKYNFFWMVRWLSKTQGPGSTNKRRVFTHCLASQLLDRLVYARRWKEAVEVTEGCFLSKRNDMLSLNMC